MAVSHPLHSTILKSVTIDDGQVFGFDNKQLAKDTYKSRLDEVFAEVLGALDRAVDRDDIETVGALSARLRSLTRVCQLSYRPR